MLFLKKCWDWCVKHWKLTLALIGSGIAFIIGYTRANRNTQRVKLDLEIKEKDIELIEENQEAFHRQTVKNILSYEEKKAELEKKRKQKMKEADSENIGLKKEILNSDEKLDKILKDEWGLKKE
jgi:t-SNARE complex subunit (syntaxin)